MKVSIELTDEQVIRVLQQAGREYVTQERAKSYASYRVKEFVGRRQLNRPFTTCVVASVCRLKERQVSNPLARLAKAGVVRNLTPGLWERVV